MQSRFIIVLIFVFISIAAFSQAKLTIVNNSMRDMTVKVMQGPGKGTLYETVRIGPGSQETVRFYTSGYYFTKTKAVLGNRDPIFKKRKIV